MNKNSFSKAIGLSNNVTIGRIINENREPSYQVLVRILQNFGETISAHWLITGEGSMIIQDYQENADNTSMVADKSPKYGSDDIMEMQRKYINELEENKELRKVLEELKKEVDKNKKGSRKAS